MQPSICERAALGLVAAKLNNKSNINELAKAYTKKVNESDSGEQVIVVYKNCLNWLGLDNSTVLI